MKAVTVIEHGGERRLEHRDHAEAAAGADEAVVAVKAFSLNNGETRHALREASTGYRPGWDLAGTIVSAPDGSGFAIGDRVLGLVFEGAWAERVAVPTRYLSIIPDELAFEIAAALPIAGLTAEVALSKAPRLQGRRVLVTAATGGVGVLAIQLASAAGAEVVAFARDPASIEQLRALGASEIAVGPAEAERLGPYDLILEGVGGRLLGEALLWLAPRGICVLFGDAAGAEETVFDARRFRLQSGGTFGGTMLYGLFLIEELVRPDPILPSPLLRDLAVRAAAGSLDPVIGRTASWTKIDAVARALLDREFVGKAVLTVD